MMLFSRKSPLFAPGLNLFYRILYMSPCYIYVVSALASPTFMIIPVLFIWTGVFPAVLTPAVLGWLIAYTVLSTFVKYYVRPGKPFLHHLRYATLVCHGNAFEVVTQYQFAAPSLWGTHWVVCMLAPLRTRSGAHFQFNFSLSRSFLATHSLARSLTHSLTHPPTQQARCSRHQSQLCVHLGAACTAC